MKTTESELAEEVAFLRRRVAELEGRSWASRPAGASPPRCKFRLNGIIEAFDGYIYVCSQDYRIEYMNGPFIRRTGYDATGDICYRALHDRDAICPWCVNDRVFQGETVRWQVQSPKDGRWFYVVNTPYYHENGVVSKQSMMIDITDQQHTRDALHETRSKYHELVENASCIILKLDSDARITFINEYGQGFFGYPGNQMTGREVIGTILADTPANRQGLNRLIQGIDAEPNRYAEIVSEVIRRDGEHRQVAWTNKPIRDPGGRLGAVMCIGHDITELKRAESELLQTNEKLERMVAERAAELLVKNRQLKQEIRRQQRTESALRESEEKYRSLVEHIGIGVSLISPSMEVLTLNRQMRQWVPDIDLSEKPKCYNLFNDPAREGICAYCPTVQTLRDGQVHEAITDTPSGDTIRHYRIISSPVTDSTGKIVAAIEMVEDITEREKLQEQLRHSEAKYRTIFETTGTALMVVEADNTISLVNSEFERLSGRTKAEIEGRMTWRDFIVAEELERMQTYHHLRRVSPEEAPRNYESRFLDAQGRTREVFVTVAMQPGTANSMVSFLDITERKRAEEALRSSEKKLRRLSSRLLHAHEEERKRIAGDLHDSIGQSLLLIKLKVETALERYRHRITKAQMAADMDALVPTIQETVEEVRRICNGLRPSLLDDLGLITTVGWCCRILQTGCPDLTIDQTIDIEEKHIPESLKIVIFRIVQEALSNVAKHSRAKKVTLSLGTDDRGILLSLTDDGAGFNLRSISSAGPDRGLGISGMRERTELSGGRFAIESARGRGTRIQATWPRDA